MNRIRRVLVVDDDDDLLRLCKVGLRRRAAWEVDVAASAEAALDAARRASPDVILLDVMMPDNDDLAILRRLKGSQETAQIPVVLMTAAAEGDLVDARAHGAAGLVPKPFDPCALPEQIARIVGAEERP